MEQQAVVRRLETGSARIVVRTLADGGERVVETPGLAAVSLVYGGNPGAPVLYLVTGEQNGGQLYQVGSSGAEPVRGAPPVSGEPLPGAGRRLVYSSGDTAVVVLTPDGTATTYSGVDPALAADRRSAVWIGQDQGARTVTVLTLGGLPRHLVRTGMPLANPALSDDGTSVVFQAMPREDWELYVMSVDGGCPRRLTHEIQHDILPRFVGRDRVLAVMG